MQIDGKQIKHVLCLGVGGVGVGPIAECLLQLGIQVSGYDGNANAICTNLKQQGAHIQQTDDIELLTPDVDVVVFSSAISLEHPILVKARQNGVITMRRAAMLAELLRLKTGIAVAGTHGKTTTSALIAHILYATHCNPSWVVGGKLQNTSTYMRWSDGEYLVVEADESDGSLIELQANVAVFTNCEADHLVNFDNDFGKLQDLFAKFLSSVPMEGFLVLNQDDQVVQQLARKAVANRINFGMHSAADYRISAYRQNGLQTEFTLSIPGDKTVELKLQIPGLHNVYNAAAAFATAHHLGVAADDIAQALKSFKGVGRRFTICGQYAFQNGNITLINDYGHHPTEVAATIQAARASFPENRLVIVFEPHRYSRTAELFTDFVSSLAQADVLLLLDTFAAGEELIENNASEDLVNALQQSGHKASFYIGALDNLTNSLNIHLRDGDVVVLLGAGSIGYVVEKFNKYKQQAEV